MNSPATRFGKLEFITTTFNGLEVIETVESETIHDYETTNKSTRSTVNVFAESRKQVLAEVLKLADKLGDDSVTDIAFECKKKTSRSAYQLQVSWTSK